MIVNELYQGQGLGNQIWNIIVTRIVAERLGYDWGIKKLNPFKGENFLTNLSLGKNVTSGLSPEGGPPTQLPDGIYFYHRESNNNYPSHMGGEPSLLFDKYLWNNLPDNTKIDGCFQSMRYINDRKDEICDWLSINNKIDKYFSDDICVIHFRGNDYLGTTAWSPADYYQNAANEMLKINKNMKFFVVTDDPDNAKKFIPFAEIIGGATKSWIPDLRMQDLRPDHGEDYKILNSAKYLILSSSTFAFWSAWTNKDAEMVIAPKYWFDYKISNGWWRPNDSIVKEWHYVDRDGKIFDGQYCIEEYNNYKKTKDFYAINGDNLE